MQRPDIKYRIILNLNFHFKNTFFTLKASAGAALSRDGLILLQLQHDGPQSGDVLGVPGCLGTKITVFGHSLPLRAGLNVIHLVSLIFSLLLSVAVLGLLYLSLVALVPVFQLLLSLHLQLFHSRRLLLVFLLQPLLLLLLPLPHKLGLLLGHVELRHPTGELRSLDVVTVVSVRQEERIVVTSRQWDRDGGWRREKIILALVISQSWRRLAGSWTDPEILSDVAQFCLFFSKKLSSGI